MVKVNFSTELKLIYQSVIVALGDRTFHDEIYLYDKLRDSLKPVINRMIEKMETNCI